MILNSISLHNFMSYADARVDLTSVNVACLSGQNGAGKSALLDAVSWAIWEGGRAPSDELVKLGEREMWVEVVFALEGQLYRVRRSRIKSGGKGASKGTLELMVRPKGGKDDEHVCDEPDGWLSLSSPTMRDTQKKLCELLRMDYDTFINSVYLRQGRADEFTTRPPAERKQVLSEILGLSYFDRLQEMAKEHARAIKGNTEILASSVKDAPEISERLCEVDAQLGQASERLNEISEKVDFYEKEKTRLGDKLQELKLFAQKLEGGKQRRGDLEADLGSLARRENEAKRKLSEASTLLTRSPEIEAAASQFHKVRSQIEALDHAALAVSDLTTRKTELQSQLATMRSRLEVERDRWQSQLNEITSKRADLLKETADREKIEANYLKFKELLAQESEMARRQEDHLRLAARQEALYSKVVEARIRLEAEIEQKQTNLAELESLLGAPQAASEEEASLNLESDRLEKAETEFQLVEEKGLRVKADLESIDSEIKEIRRKQKENVDKYHELEDHSGSSICPLCSAPIVDRAAVINRYKNQNQALDNEISALTTKSEVLDSERQALRKRYVELRQMLDERKKLDTRIGQFNEKMAAIERARQNHQKLAHELKVLKSRLDNQDFAQVERESLVAVKAEIHLLDFDPVIYSNLQSQIRAGRHIEGKNQQLQKDLKELSRLEEEVPRLAEKEKTIADTLASESYGSELRAELGKLSADIVAYDYDRLQHQRLKQELSDLLPSSELARELARVRSEKPDLDAELDEVVQSIETRRKQLSQLTDDLTLWQDSLSKSSQIEAEASQLAPVLAGFRQDKDDISAELAVLSARKSDLELQKADLDARASDLEKLKEELDDYLFLAEAFGKKGIQAVIIENAVPEIESEANRILSRLSDNKMHVALATQHKTKAGSIVETLDLLIGDEVGTRSYELYSGGEAFKVDFAVRVALSKLLARRSGAKLETLIIDEGFGSQDELSRERMVKAINSIRGDFSRILVITHIAEIKEMFPVQILVAKRNGASTIEVLS